MRALVLFPFLMFGCPNPDDKSPDTGGDADTDSDSDADSDTDTDTDADLTDARESMVEDASGCEDFEGTELAGGARYFWGEYLGNETDGWSGTEAAYVFANAKWVDLGGEDCVSYWAVTATAGSTGACPTCEVGMDVDAVYDVVNSTCPEDMWGTGAWTETYAVDLASGAATFYYAGSGETVGAGYGEESVGANFLSERACSWF